jgi:SAM-dependent methyltransferase
MPNFDPLVKIYRALEVVAFGRDLERARFAFMNRLKDRRDILILGEGDGRFVARLLSGGVNGSIHCVDFSPAMLARAKARIAGQPGAERVRFTCADALTAPFEPARYDAVVTLFFLDCFEAEAARRMVSSLARALRPGAGWLFADFVLPTGGIARVRARMWLFVLYLFFRWKTGLQVRALPPSEQLIEELGFRKIDAKTLQWGLLRAAWFERSD